MTLCFRKQISFCIFLFCVFFLTLLVPFSSCLCRENQDCLPGLKCSRSTQHCVFQRCRRSRQCSKGLSCRGRICRNPADRPLDRPVLRKFRSTISRQKGRLCRQMSHCPDKEICTKHGVCRRQTCSSSERCRRLTGLPVKCSQGYCKGHWCADDSDCPENYACSSDAECSPVYGTCGWDTDCECSSSQLECVNQECFCKDQDYSTCSAHCHHDGHCASCQRCHNSKCIYASKNCIEDTTTPQECLDQLQQKQVECCADSDCREKCRGNCCHNGKCNLLEQGKPPMPDRCRCRKDRDCADRKGLECRKCIQVAENLEDTFCAGLNPNCCTNEPELCKANEACIAGSCEIRKCNVDTADCPECFTCSADQCIPLKNCCTQDSDCSDGMACQRNKCRKIQNCQEDEDCHKCEQCLKNSDGRSAKHCTTTKFCCKKNGDCDKDNYCKDGVCTKEDECNTEGDCDTCYACNNRQCSKIDTCCQNNSDCEEDMVCSKSKQICIFRTKCKEQDDCHNCEKCTESEDLEGGSYCHLTDRCCKTDSDCGQNYLCTEGVCTEENKCEKNEDCEACFLCIKGQCLKDKSCCKNNSDCDKELVCSKKQHKCVFKRKCSKQKHCLKCELCSEIDGIEGGTYCKSTDLCCKKDANCEHNYICTEGTCTKNEECKENYDCGTCFLCHEGQCLKEDNCCQDHSDCTGENMACSKSKQKCIYKKGCHRMEDCHNCEQCIEIDDLGGERFCQSTDLCCKKDVDCKQNFLCLEGTCTKEDECKRNQDCDACNICSKGQCLRQENCCKKDSDCQKDMFCSKWEEKCIPMKQCNFKDQCHPCESCIGSKMRGSKKLCHPTGRCCRSDEDCGRDGFCRKGTCEKIGQCAEDHECPNCHTCSWKKDGTNSCKKSRTCCEEEICPSAEQVCINGGCVIRGANCSVNDASSCPFCQRCGKERCEKSEVGCCSASAQCPKSYVCENGGCFPVRPCSLDSDCKHCEICSSESSLSDDERATCVPDPVCNSPTPTPAVTPTVTLTPAQTLPTPSCESSSDCHGNNTACVDGNCAPVHACQVDTDCPVCSHCKFDKDQGKVCREAKLGCCKRCEDCPNGSCWNGGCHAHCHAHADCTSCETCAPLLGLHRLACQVSKECCSRDQDCPPAMECDRVGTGRCVRRKCLDDYDCEPEEVCRGDQDWGVCRSRRDFCPEVLECGYCEDEMELLRVQMELEGHGILLDEEDEDEEEDGSTPLAAPSSLLTEDGKFSVFLDSEPNVDELNHSSGDEEIEYDVYGNLTNYEEFYEDEDDDEEFYLDYKSDLSADDYYTYFT